MSLVKNKKIPILLISIGAMLMVFVALASSHIEIILPTFGALMTGAWLVQDNLWHYHKLNLCVSVFVSACIGLLISIFATKYGMGLYCPGLYIGFLFAALILVVGRTQIYPCFGAMTLPIILHTTSFWYPVSVLCLVAVLVGVQFCLEKTGMRKPLDEGEFPDLPGHRLDRMKYYLRLSTGLVPALATVFLMEYNDIADIHLLLQAPLFVSYGTFCNEHSFFIKHPVNTWLQLVLASILGTISWGCGHWLTVTGMVSGVMTANMTMAIFAGMAVCTMLMIGEVFKKRFPPAISLIITPFVINGPYMFPVFISIGAAYVMLMTWCVRRHPSYQGKDMRYMK